MKTSSKRILSILFSALFLMATLIIYGNLIQPEIQASSEKQSIVASKQSLFDNQEAVVSQVSKLIGQLQNAAQLQQTLSLVIPVGGGVTDILNQWEGIAEVSQVTIQSLNIKPPTVLLGTKQPLQKRLGNLEIEASVSGTYGELKQFLRALESSTRITNVNSFDIKPFFSNVAGSQSSSEGTYTLQVSAVVFYQEQ